mmetsp:Transcript_19504/g.66892  ORF Transcript_19504/g.66892 Transcript_19504/m.66892 type:complete len:335 (+) Transcript_19504:1259-2263(+)
MRARLRSLRPIWRRVGPDPSVDARQVRRLRAAPRAGFRRGVRGRVRGGRVWHELEGEALARAVVVADEADGLVDKGACDIVVVVSDEKELRLPPRATDVGPHVQALERHAVDARVVQELPGPRPQRPRQRARDGEPLQRRRQAPLVLRRVRLAVALNQRLAALPLRLEVAFPVDFQLRDGQVRLDPRLRRRRLVGVVGGVVGGMRVPVPEARQDVHVVQQVRRRRDGARRAALGVHRVVVVVAGRRAAVEAVATPRVQPVKVECHGSRAAQQVAVHGERVRARRHRARPNADEDVARAHAQRRRLARDARHDEPPGLARVVLELEAHAALAKRD